jgi:hypothetical protein
MKRRAHGGKRSKADKDPPKVCQPTSTARVAEKDTSEERVVWGWKAETNGKIVADARGNLRERVGRAGGDEDKVGVSTELLDG